jgi:hypothetical protein
MDNMSTQPPSKSGSDTPKVAKSSALWIAGFDIGSTYIFHDTSQKTKEHWESIFANQGDWVCEQFDDRYRKPMGWKVSLKINSITGIESSIGRLVTVFKDKFKLELKSENIEAMFFTPGVGILTLRLDFCDHPESMTTIMRLEDSDERREIRRLIKSIARACAQLYSDRMNQASKSQQSLGKKAEWKLAHFEEVSRTVTAKPVNFILSFLDPVTYAGSISRIREQVPGSDERRAAIDDRARSKYLGVDIYHGWSEAA